MTIIIKTPILGSDRSIGAGSHEVAQCSDIWIPAQSGIEVIRKVSTADGAFDFGGSVNVEKSLVEGFHIRTRQDPVTTGHVIAGKFKTPAPDFSSPRSPAHLVADKATMSSLSDVLAHVLIQMLGGKVSILPEDIDAVMGRGIMTHNIQDPLRYTVELV